MKDKRKSQPSIRPMAWGSSEEPMIQVRLEDYDHAASDQDGVPVNSDAVIESALRQWAVERFCPDYGIRVSVARRDVDLMSAIEPGLSPEREADRVADHEIQATRLLQPIRGTAEFYSSIPA